MRFLMTRWSGRMPMATVSATTWTLTTTMTASRTSRIPTRSIQRLTHLRFTAVRSDEEGDAFGYFAVRINDLDDDGSRDLAVSAPAGNEELGEAAGKVYLLSLNDVTAPTDAPTTSLGARSLADVMSAGNSWLLHGASDDEHVGQQLVVLDRANTEPELVVRSDQVIYIVPLDTTGLTTLDAADGTEDRQISLNHCESDDSCVRLAFGSDLIVTDVASAG